MTSNRLMPARRLISVISAAALTIVAVPAAVSAQWLDYPTAGVPRTPDGKPDLLAPTPRTVDGKPDLSGMWGWETRANCGAHCNDSQISREFINVAATCSHGSRCASSALKDPYARTTGRVCPAERSRSTSSRRVSRGI